MDENHEIGILGLLEFSISVSGFSDMWNRVIAEKNLITSVCIVYSARSTAWPLRPRFRSSLYFTNSIDTMRQMSNSDAKHNTTWQFSFKRIVFLHTVCQRNIDSRWTDGKCNSGSETRPSSVKACLPPQLVHVISMQVTRWCTPKIFAVSNNFHKFWSWQLQTTAAELYKTERNRILDPTRSRKLSWFWPPCPDTDLLSGEPDIIPRTESPRT